MDGWVDGRDRRQGREGTTLESDLKFQVSSFMPYLGARSRGSRALMKQLSAVTEKRFFVRGTQTHERKNNPPPRHKAWHSEIKKSRVVAKATSVFLSFLASPKAHRIPTDATCRTQQQFGSSTPFESMATMMTTMMMQGMPLNIDKKNGNHLSCAASSSYKSCAVKLRSFLVCNTVE